MPTPSVWAKAVAAPSNTDPYAAMEGVSTIPSYAGGNGAALHAPVQTKGHWSEAFNPSAPGFWILAAILIALGVLHLGAGVKVGKARLAVQA